MTINPWRAEVGIMLGGKIHVMRPTFAALSRIEQELHTGLLALAGKLFEGNITLEELAVIINCCLMESSIPVNDALVQGGVTGAMQAVAEMFALVFGGFDEIVT